MCPTPVGMSRDEEAFFSGIEFGDDVVDDNGNDASGLLRRPRVLKIFAGGTVCTDVSAIGMKAGLLGESCRTLAIFLSEIKHCKPQLVFHECTSQFFASVFSKYLPEFKVNTINFPEEKLLAGLRLRLLTDSNSDSNSDNYFK